MSLERTPALRYIRSEMIIKGEANLMPTFQEVTTVLIISLVKLSEYLKNEPIYRQSFITFN
ncbi:MAG: hypothetical protein MRQ13_02940 [Candidatus Midichloria sp.]|nr:hypothetical protein [Candidatus Midichloria sp.]